MSEYPLEVTQKLAVEVMAKPNYITLITKTAELFGRASQCVVTTDEEEVTASDLMVEIRAVEKDVEALRKDAVRMPNMYVKSINDTFRSVKDNLGKAVNLAAGPIQKYREDKRQKAEEEYQEKLKAAQEADQLVGGGGNGAVESLKIPEPEPPVVENVTKSEKGSVYEKEIVEVEVTDFEKLVKAVVSKAKGNAHVTMGCLKANLDELKRIVTTEKKKIPGVKKVVRKQLVTRSK